MVKYLLLFLLLTSAHIYGQEDVKFKKYDGLFSYIMLTPKEDKGIVAFRRGKSQYNEQPLGTSDFWISSFENIQKRYISPEEKKRILESKTHLIIHMIIDYQGKMQYVSINMGTNIFDFITKKQIIDIYHDILKIKAPVNGLFGKDQYFQFTYPLIRK